MTTQTTTKNTKHQKQTIHTTCNYCNQPTTLKGEGNWRADIQEFDWYSSTHKCKVIDQLQTEANKLSTVLLRGGELS